MALGGLLRNRVTGTQVHLIVEGVEQSKEGEGGKCRCGFRGSLVWSDAWGRFWNLKCTKKLILIPRSLSHGVCYRKKYPCHLLKMLKQILFKGAYCSGVLY